MNRDELDGKAHEITGKVKQAIGKATNDPELHDEGVGEELGGKAEAGVARVRRKVGEAIKDVGDAIKK